MMPAAVAVVAAVLAAPAAHAPAVCPRYKPIFSLEFGAWGGPGTGLPRRELFAAAVTRGAPEGFKVYGSATPTKATVDSVCRPARPLRGAASERRLSKPYVYEVVGHSGSFRAPNGEVLPFERISRTTIDPRVTRGALGVSFTCYAGGEVTVSMSNYRGGTAFTVRIGRELFASAIVRPNDQFTFRVSKRCERS